jgi:sulfur dioxygenase
MLFQQLFDKASATYTYLLGDPAGGQAVLIDPVQEHVPLYLSLVRELNLVLAYILETHVHADHVTGGADLRAATGAKLAVGKHTGAACADIQIEDGDRLQFGEEVLEAIATPGHTPGCMSYLWHDRVFTGDALLIAGCGRTDFQGGDAGTLYDSVTRKLFTLPGETLVYPGHDYRQRHVSSIAQERDTNPRLAGKSRDEFVALMAKLDLPEPKLMEQAVAANQRCGRSDTLASPSRTHTL